VPIVSTIEDDMKSVAANDGLSDPRHTARATRAAGRQMRSRLLDTASRLFKEQGLAAVSIADIAAAANAFPSQITYYFHTKEALFVEAACRDVLYVARAAEQHAGKQLSPEDYTRALVDSVMGSDAVGFFVEAMTLTRRRQDLAPLVERTVERLHSEGLRAYAAEMAARGWRSRLDPDTSARRFWAIAIGVTLEGHAMGRSPDDLAAEMLRLIGQQADAPPASVKLKVVGAGSSSLDRAVGSSLGSSPAGKEKQQ
jgi:AcrR family transcriptional regulator